MNSMKDLLIAAATTARWRRPRMLRRCRYRPHGTRHAEKTNAIWVPGVLLRLLQPRILPGAEFQLIEPRSHLGPYSAAGKTPPEVDIQKHLTPEFLNRG